MYSADDDRIREDEGRSISQIETVPTDGTITATVNGTKTSMRHRFLADHLWQFYGESFSRLIITWRAERKAQ